MEKKIVSPKKIEGEKQLEEILTRPSRGLVRMVSQLKGDLLILGVSGKMGPTLAILARRAIAASGVKKMVIGVARFSSLKSKQRLEDCGIETISCDLLHQNSINKLPAITNVIFMVGTKFGTTGNETLTWAANAYLPGAIAQKFKKSKIIALSTGNVYPLVPIVSGGSKETGPTGPVGEYAQSCLARERVFEYFSRILGIPMVVIRLSFAIDLRYGVLLDIAKKVAAGTTIDLKMGYVNFIWQGDANESILKSFTICETPPKFLNLTGREKLSVRQTAEKFGELLNRKPVFKNKEASTALITDTAELGKCLGYPKISPEQMIQWVAHWVSIGGSTWNKPTHFEEREGKF